MKLRPIRACLAVIAAILVSSVTSQAGFVITPTNYKDGAAAAVNWTYGTNAWKGNYNDGNASQLPTPLQSLGLQTLYKFTPSPSSEQGYYKDNYATTTPAPGYTSASGLIKWGGGAFITSSVKYLLLKDGNLDDYVFNISSWNGKDDLIFHSFWGGNQGKLSHLTILGYEPSDGPVPVPEPASACVWIAAAAACAFGRRLRRRNLTA